MYENDKFYPLNLGGEKTRPENLIHDNMILFYSHNKLREDHIFFRRKISFIINNKQN